MPEVLAVRRSSKKLIPRGIPRIPELCITIALSPLRAQTLDTCVLTKPVVRNAIFAYKRIAAFVPSARPDDTEIQLASC